MSEAVTPEGKIEAGAFVGRALRYMNYAMEIIAPRLPRLKIFGCGTRQTQVDGLTVRCHRALPDDPALNKAWEELYQRVPNATPFHSPAWQRSLLETPDAMRRLRLFTVYDGPKLVAVLPLESRMGRILRTSG